MSGAGIWNPLIPTVGREWAKFQVLRRANASLSRKARIDDKVAADQRGHWESAWNSIYGYCIRSRKTRSNRFLVQRSRLVLVERMVRSPANNFLHAD